MKKITLIFALMITSLGFAQQVLIEDFESTPPATFTFAGFEGLASATIVSDPAAGGTRMKGLQLVSQTSGNPWQGAEALLQTSKIKLTTDKTVKVDVYGTQAFTMLCQVESGAPTSAASQSYTTPGAWQTLTFDFAVPRNGLPVANGEYAKIVFFPNWKADNTGFGTPANFTVHVDNVFGEKVVVAPPFTPGPATTPLVPDAQVFSVYGDTGGYTNIWVKDYSFGGVAGRPDLDPTAGVNEAIKMDFSSQGYGEGLEPAAPRKDVSAYGFLNFDYYVQSGEANAGTLGHQFYFDVIHKVGNGANIETFYGIGTALTTAGNPSEHVKKLIVFDSWQTVSIPMADLIAAGFSPANFFQFKIGASSDLRTKVAFFDNIYFSVNDPALGTSKFETSSVKMYPNPVRNTLNIEANGSINKVSVYNVLGQEVMSVSPKSNSATLQTNDLQKGVYMVTTDIEGNVSTSKVIKE